MSEEKEMIIPSGQSAVDKSPVSITVWQEREGDLTGDILRVLESLGVAAGDVEAVAVVTRQGKKLHPILASAGRFKDDPLWDETMEAIRRNRESLDSANVPVSE